MNEQNRVVPSRIAHLLNVGQTHTIKAAANDCGQQAILRDWQLQLTILPCTHLPV